MRASRLLTLDSKLAAAYYICLHVICWWWAQWCCELWLGSVERSERGGRLRPRGAPAESAAEKRRAKQSRWGGAARDPPNALGFPLTGNNYFGRRGAPPAQTGGKQSRWARHLRGTPGAVPGAVPLRSKNARRFFLCTPVGVQVPRACAAQHRLALLRLLPRCSGARARTTPPTLSATLSLGKKCKTRDSVLRARIPSPKNDYFGFRATLGRHLAAIASAEHSEAAPGLLRV